MKIIQCLAGTLNFLTKAIYPGRVFTRRMYSKIIGKTKKLRQYHHVTIDTEFQADCKMWLSFLQSEHLHTFCRPFLDLTGVADARDIGFFTDSSANKDLGFGGVIGDKQWFYGKWEKNYITDLQPSIEYLELLAVLIGSYIWSNKLANQRLVIHCDNMAVVGMVNKMASSCRRCMHLLRLLVRHSLFFNFRVYAIYMRSKSNDLADSLSRLQFDRFRRLSRGMRNKMPKKFPEELWPASKIWNSSYI